MRLVVRWRLLGACSLGRGLQPMYRWPGPRIACSTASSGSVPSATPGFFRARSARRGRARCGAARPTMTV